MRSLFLFFLWVALALAWSPLAGRAEQSINHAVRLTASVTQAPATITLAWAPETDATGYSVARKTPDAPTWTSLATLAGTVGTYQDRGIALGTEYEYRVVKTTAGYTAYGYLSAGIAVPPVEQRGRVILLVDDTQASALVSELARLQQDLVGDGWLVLRHDISRTASPAAVKEVIMADYRAVPNVTTAVFLFGHVPVPYAGDFAPDGHQDHTGAWPADVFYADATGTWTDSQVNDAQGADARNHNLPGDGKYDQSVLPGTARLQVGRVDVSDLPRFSLGETELLRRYLNKDHDFRHKNFTVNRQGMVFDRFGTDPSFGGPYADDGWSNLSALLGPAKVKAATASFPNWNENLGKDTWLFAYACGGGTPTYMDSVVSTDLYADAGNTVVFTMLFGSHFGDWDQTNDLMRALLASEGYGLSAAWAGIPFWHFHPMGQGHTLGYCARLTQNNAGLYHSGDRARGVHIALMGDPTLRLHPLAPPTFAQAQVVGGAAHLTWQASPEQVAGYHLYRATSSAGPYQRLNGGPIAGTSFDDGAAPATAFYQVKAVRLESSNSGSYWNTSQAALVSLTSTVVTMEVRSAVATAAGPTAGEVVLTRTGLTDQGLTVPLSLSGSTARAGFDFEALPAAVTIPAGATSARLLIHALETVAPAGKVLRLTPQPGEGYLARGSAVVTIAGPANAFVAWRGVYQGMVDSATLRVATIKVTVLPAGTFTAALRVGLQKYVVIGQLDLQGDFTGAIAGLADSTLALHLDFATGEFSGQVLQGGQAAGSFTAASLPAGPAPAGLPGLYNFVLTQADGAQFPGGWGRVVVDGTGHARLSGKLSDGSMLSKGTVLTATPGLVIYQPLANGGSVAGGLAFASTSERDLGGDWQWSGPARAGTPLAASGYARLALAGSRFVAPAVGNRLLPMANAAGNAVFTAGGGGSTAALTAGVTLSNPNVALALPPNRDRLTLTVVPATGFIFGQWVPDGAAQPVAFSSVVLSKTNRAEGFFARADGIGRISLAASPDFPTPEVPGPGSRPVVTIAQPALGKRVAPGAAPVHFSGTAAFAPGLASVQYQVVQDGHAGALQTATGTASWSFEVPVPATAGVTYLYLKAIGTNGRESLQVVRGFTTAP